jgi:large subunit ribosomal protein L32e
MKFLRRNSNSQSKLGRKRKKKQMWRKPKGRHNKMRDQKRGYPGIVKIGFRKNRKQQRKLEGMEPVLIMNTHDLERVKTGEIGIIGSIGMKKKIEIIRKAKERGTLLYNINIKKFLKRNIKPEKNTEEKKK